MKATHKGNTHSSVTWLPAAALAMALGAFPAAADEDNDARSVVDQMDQTLRNSARRDRAEVENAINDLNRSLVSTALDETPGEDDFNSTEIVAEEINDLEAADGAGTPGVGASSLDSDSAQGDGAPLGDWEPFVAPDELSETVFSDGTDAGADEPDSMVEPGFIDDGDGLSDEDEGESGGTGDSG